MMRPDATSTHGWSNILRGVWFSVLAIGFVGPVSAQSEPTHFRDLGKTLGPQELVRRLRRFQAAPVEETALFSELEKLGNDIFDSLSPEERTNARKFAEQLIRNKGIDSDEVKGLMDRMGVDPETQKQLSEQFKSSGLQSRLPKDFKDLSYDELRKGTWDRDRFQRELDNAGVGDELRRLIQPGMLGSRPNPDATREDRGDRNQSRDSANPKSPADDPFSDPKNEPSEVGDQSKPRDGDRKDVDANTKSGRDRQANGLDREVKGNSQTESTRRPTPSNGVQSVPVDPASQSLRQLRRERARNLERLRAAAKGRQRSEEEQNQFRELLEKQRQLDDTIRAKANGPETSPRQSGRDANRPKTLPMEPKSESDAKDLSKLSNQEWAKKFAEVANEVVPKLDQRQQRTGDTPGNLFSGDALKTLQKLKDGIKNNLTPDKSENIGGLLENSSNFLSRAAGKKSAEKVEAQFDRLLFETAKATMKAANEKDDSILGEAINSMIESSVDVVKDGVKSSRKAKRDAERQARGSRRDQPWEPPSFDDDDMSSIMNNLANRSSDRPANNNPERDSDRRTSLFGGSDSAQDSNSPSAIKSLESPMEAVAGLFNAQSLILLFVGGLLLTAMVYLLMKLIPEDSPEARRKQLVQKLKNVAVRDASDLVDAVDLYLLAHHGNGSSWWHAEMAKEVVETEKPHLKERVRKLFDVYVISRYTDAQNAISPEDQTLAETTLKQLAVPASTSDEKKSAKPGQVGTGEA